MPIELVMLSNHLIPCPLLLLPSIFPIIRVFSNELALGVKWPKYWSFSIRSSSEYSGLISFRIDWLVWSPCSPRNSQESSPAPQLESINSLGTQPSLWSTYHICTRLLKNHSWLDEPFSAKWCLLFLIRCLGLLCFSSKEQVSFNFMATVTIYSNFRDQEKKIYHYFYFFPFYLPWNDRIRCHDLHFFNVEF